MLASQDVDLEELIRNIVTARDTAKADAERYRQMAEEERASGDAAAALGRTNVAMALDVVAATLDRILGEA